jgi:hypothetical protein
MKKQGGGIAKILFGDNYLSHDRFARVFDYGLS